MPIKNADGLFEQEIDGHRYEFQKWNTEESLETLMDAMAVLGQSAGGMASHVAKTGTFKTELPDVTVEDFMTRLSGQLINNRPMVLRVIKKLASNKMLCDGKTLDFNSHYADRLPHMFNVARYNAEVQYQSFFSVLKGTKGGSLFAQLAADKQAQTPPQAAQPSAP